MCAPPSVTLFIYSIRSCDVIFDVLIVRSTFAIFFAISNFSSKKSVMITCFAPICFNIIATIILIAPAPTIKHLDEILKPSPVPPIGVNTCSTARIATAHGSNNVAISDGISSGTFHKYVPGKI